MKILTKAELWAKLARFDDTEVLGLTADILNECDAFRIENSELKNYDFTIEVYASCSMTKNMAMQAAGIGWRKSTKIMMEIKPDRLSLIDLTKNQFLDIIFDWRFF